MRTLIAAVLLACAGAAPALETARSLSGAGAPHLALARVEQFQPRDSAASGWAEWETLRLALLVQVGRYEEALKRAAALPENLPQPALRRCLLAAARAAVAAGQGALARRYAARLLWQLDFAAEEARAARLLVIDSHLVERQGETAFRAMLRFEQDYRPLERDTAGRFVGALLDAGLNKQAVNWLGSLEDASATKLRVQLRNGLIGPQAAIMQARAQLSRIAKGGDGAAYWKVLVDAAERQGDGGLRLEALEGLLNHAGGGNARAPQSAAQDLWQAYLLEAQAAANRNRLLAGDDGAWVEHAARRLAASPYESRALYAYLARNAKTGEARANAQFQLVFSLYQGGLDHTALRLFGDGQIAADALDPRARYLLGTIAEERNVPGLAVRFWHGLPVPPDSGEAQWQVRLATVQWRAGATEAAAVAMRTLAMTGKPLPGPAAGGVLALARDMRAAGHPAISEEMLVALLPLAEGEPAREMLFTLGEIKQTAGQFAGAADYFLRYALARGAQPPDARSLQARLAAASNLARAGFRDDARAQYEWVIGNSKDAAQIAVARRELSRL